MIAGRDMAGYWGCISLQLSPRCYQHQYSNTQASSWHFLNVGGYSRLRVSAHSLTLSRHAGTFSIITHADARPSPLRRIALHRKTASNRCLLSGKYQARYCVCLSFALCRHSHFCAVMPSCRHALRAINDIAPQRNNFLTLAGCFLLPYSLKA